MAEMSLKLLGQMSRLGGRFRQSASCSYVLGRIRLKEYCALNHIEGRDILEDQIMA